MSNFWNNSCSLPHIWIYYMTPFPFNLGLLSLTLMLLCPHCLIILPPPAIFSLEKVKIQGQRQIMIHFISLAGLKSHVCELETATSLPTILVKSHVCLWKALRKLKSLNVGNALEDETLLNLLNPLGCQHCFGWDRTSGRSLEGSGV